MKNIEERKQLYTLEFTENKSEEQIKEITEKWENLTKLQQQTETEKLAIQKLLDIERKHNETLPTQNCDLYKIPLRFYRFADIFKSTER